MAKTKEECACVKAEKACSPCRNGECWHFGKLTKGIPRMCMNCNETGFQLSQEDVVKNYTRRKEMYSMPNTNTERLSPERLAEIEERVVEQIDEIDEQHQLGKHAYDEQRWLVLLDAKSLLSSLRAVTEELKQVQASSYTREEIEKLRDKMLMDLRETKRITEAGIIENIAPKALGILEVCEDDIRSAFTSLLEREK